MNTKKLNSVEIFGIVSVIILSVAIFFISKWCDYDIYKIYVKDLRSSLFSGFLTIGGFLLTLKTFIIIKLKEDVYDQPEYREMYDKGRAILIDSNKEPKGTIYDTLRNLSDYLIFCVISSLISAVLHFSLGFYECNITASICISSSIITIFVVIRACLAVRKSLSIMFDQLEKKEKKYYESPKIERKTFNAKIEISDGTNKNVTGTII